jgi:Fe-S cluster assembly iron-binding protein IscA
MMALKSFSKTRPRPKLAITDRALVALANLRSHEGAGCLQAIGVVPVAGGGVGLVLDEPGPSDRVFSRNDLPVLFVAADMERRLRGRVVDFVDDAGKERFTLERVIAQNARVLVDPGLSSLAVGAPLPREEQLMTEDSNTQVVEESANPNLVEIIDDKRPDGFGFHIRVLATGRLYRIEPARDPRQPRFWCFKIYRCLSSRLVDVSQRSWFGAGGMTRDQLPAASEAIKADPNAWLETEELSALRRWIFEEEDDSDGGADFWT